jgi:serine/threonine-protein kinase
MPTLTCPRCTSRFDDGATFCPQDGTRLVTLGDDPLVGQVLAERYRVVRLIGRGGMGRVYEAEHVNIVKRLALKVLHPEAVSDPVIAARFRLEARAASQIGHPNIVAIEDSATLADGTVYVAMELLEGESLAERMRRSPPLSLAEAAELLLPVCDGLAAAHAAQIVHRDLKPENIFLARRGGKVVPKILDFGIAKVLTDDGALHLTRTGAIFGTPAYMSPQQAQGGKIDHRTDIYSMGVILFEVATGRVPFVADTAVELLSLHISSEPPRPSEIAPDRKVSPTVDALILSALAKDPDQRPKTITDFAASLRSSIAATVVMPVTVVRTEPEPVPVSSSAAVPIPNQPKSRRALLAALIVLALLLTGAIVTIALNPPKAPVAAAAILPDAGAATAVTVTPVSKKHDEPHHAHGAAGSTVKDATQTGLGGARDGTRTVGRTIRSFFKEGPQGAKETWKDNAATTKKNALEGGRKTKND